MEEEVILETIVCITTELFSNLLQAQSFSALQYFPNICVGLKDKYIILPKLVYCTMELIR